MLPIRSRSIFKSRWIALLWAAGIIWSAVEFTGAQTHGHAAQAGNAQAASNSQTAGQGDGDDSGPSAADIAAAKAAIARLG